MSGLDSTKGRGYDLTDRRWRQLKELREQMVEASRGLPLDSSLLAFASRLGSILAENSRVGSPSTHQDSPIERFNVGPDPEHPGFSEMHPASEGRWVRYSDHRSVVERLVEAAGDVIEFEAQIERSGDAGSMEDYENAIHDLREAVSKAQASLKGDADA